MKVSLNQIEQTARKAARGAGLAWGLADEVGRALRWLHAYNLNGVAALAAHLDAIGGDYQTQAPAKLTGVWLAADGILDPLLTGAALSDCAARIDNAGIATAAIAHPLLAAGFVGVAADSDDLAFELTWADCALHCARGRARVSGPAAEINAAAAEFMRCRLSEFRGHPRHWRAPRIGEATVAAEAWTRLERHAQRIYVPATAASRLAGAGAGLQVQ